MKKKRKTSKAGTAEAIVEKGAKEERKEEEEEVEVVVEEEEEEEGNTSAHTHTHAHVHTNRKRSRASTADAHSRNKVVRAATLSSSSRATENETGMQVGTLRPLLGAHVRCV